jgi:hypothetical protein
MARLVIALPLLWLAACHGPGRVEYTDGKCFIDGEVARLDRVQARQAEVQARILDRQPWFVVVTLLVVVLAGASHVEKLIVLLGARRAQARGLGERIRAALESYRAHPIRYFAIVTGTLALLVCAAGLYIYLDADKRASERALGQLQFCHLALRTAEEQSVLDAQRKNLESIESTAGDIRSLVDKLPPEEKEKAEQIVRSMRAALDKQGSLVSSYFKANDEQARALDARSQALERGLSTVEANVLSLKSVPLALKDLSDAVKRIDNRLGAIDGRLDGLDGNLKSLDAQVKTLASRPVAAPPAPADGGARKAPDAGAKKL